MSSGSENIQGTFGGKTGSSGALSYAHPHEKEVIKKAREILKQSETGGALLKVIDSNKVSIKLIKNRNSHGMTPTKEVIYVGLPPNQKEPDASMVLELGGSLRECQQEIVGFTVPDENVDPLRAAAMKHAKFLDIVVHMCKIGHELTERTGVTDYIRVIEDLGHGEIYKAHLEQVGELEMAKTYNKVREKLKQQDEGGTHG